MDTRGVEALVLANGGRYFDASGNRSALTDPAIHEVGGFLLRYAYEEETIAPAGVGPVNNPIEAFLAGERVL